MHVDIQAWLHHYGYIGVFFILFMEVLGIPFPAETTLTISGIAWTQGVFALAPLVLVAAAGNILGSTIAYGIGRYLGRPVILRYGRYVGITEPRLAAAEAKFAKYRNTIVLFGKFIAGVRILIPYLAGINRMPFVLFTVYNTVSAFVWVAVFVVLGRTIGVEWTRYHALLHRYLVPAIVIAVILVGLYAGWKLRARRKRRKP